ncbi:unnamed protein product [Closterium sp. Naga37s-1]|nr:unnamed protein product [Closterium sp. Naga37s-1]
MAGFHSSACPASDLSQSSGPSVTEETVSLVQASDKGIGLAFVEQLLKRQPTGRVIATCRDPMGAQHLDALHDQSGGRLDVMQLDVTKEDTIEAVAAAVRQKYGKLDLLLNVAGVLHRPNELQPESSLHWLCQDAMLLAYRVNAMGPMLVLKHMMPLLVTGGHTNPNRPYSIVANMSSRTGSISDNHIGGWYSYRASKAALNQFTKTAAVELAAQKSPVVAVLLHPGTVDTDLTRPFTAHLPADKIFTPDFAAEQLLGVIDGLSPSDNGRFIAYDGTDVACILRPPRFPRFRCQRRPARAPMAALAVRAVSAAAAAALPAFPPSHRRASPAARETSLRIGGREKRGCSNGGWSCAGRRGGAVVALAAPPETVTAIVESGAATMVSAADWTSHLVLATLNTAATPASDGPIKLPPAYLEDPWAIPEVSPLQSFASILLTGTIGVLLFRAIKRRASKVTESRFRSDSVEKLSSNPVVEERKRRAAEEAAEAAKRPPPTVLNTLGGALVAGSIAIVLYKFATSVDDVFAGQTLSTTYTVRNLSIAVRTIVSGLVWLATFIFALNSLGLTLYAFQLALGIDSPKDSPVTRSGSDADTVGSKDSEAKEAEVPVGSEAKKPLGFGGEAGSLGGTAGADEVLIGRVAAIEEQLMLQLAGTSAEEGKREAGGEELEKGKPLFTVTSLNRTIRRVDLNKTFLEYHHHFREGELKLQCSGEPCPNLGSCGPEFPNLRACYWPNLVDAEYLFPDQPINCPKVMDMSVEGGREVSDTRCTHKGDDLRLDMFLPQYYELRDVYLDGDGLVFNETVFFDRHSCADKGNFSFEPGKAKVRHYDRLVSLMYPLGIAFYHVLIELVPHLFVLSPLLRDNPSIPIAIASHQVKAFSSLLVPFLGIPATALNLAVIPNRHADVNLLVHVDVLYQPVYQACGRSAPAMWGELRRRFLLPPAGLPLFRPGLVPRHNHTHFLPPTADSPATTTSTSADSSIPVRAGDISETDVPLWSDAQTARLPYSWRAVIAHRRGAMRHLAAFDSLVAEMKRVFPPQRVFVFEGDLPILQVFPPQRVFVFEGDLPILRGAYAVLQCKVYGWVMLRSYQSRFYLPVLRTVFPPQRVFVFEGDLPILQAKLLFNRAAVYVGLHGAGLSNMIFMPSNHPSLPSLLVLHPTPFMNQPSFSGNRAAVFVGIARCRSKLLFNRAAVYVVLHGAGLSNMIFMPSNHPSLPSLLVLHPTPFMNQPSFSGNRAAVFVGIARCRSKLLFNRAAVYVGLHGAGLSNMIFMPSNHPSLPSLLVLHPTPFMNQPSFSGNRAAVFVGIARCRSTLLFNRAAVYVGLHGAGLSNMIFMPSNHPSLPSLLVLHPTPFMNQPSFSGNRAAVFVGIARCRCILHDLHALEPPCHPHPCP